MFPLLLLSLVAAVAATTRQSFLREPFDQIATVGEHVTLPCRVSDRRGVLQWTRDDFGLGSDRRLDGFSRYTMTGSDDEGKNSKSGELFSWAVFLSAMYLSSHYAKSEQDIVEREVEQ